MSLKYHLMVTPGKRETIFLLASLGIGKIKVVAAFSKTAFLFSHLVFCFLFPEQHLSCTWCPGGWRETSSYKSQIRSSKMKKKPHLAPFPSLVTSLIQPCFWILLELQSSSGTRSCHFTTLQFQSINYINLLRPDLCCVPSQFFFSCSGQG